MNRKNYQYNNMQVLRDSRCGYKPLLEMLTQRDLRNLTITCSRVRIKLFINLFKFCLVIIFTISDKTYLNDNLFQNGVYRNIGNCSTQTARPSLIDSCMTFTNIGCLSQSYYRSDIWNACNYATFFLFMLKKKIYQTWIKQNR